MTLLGFLYDDDTVVLFGQLSAKGLDQEYIAGLLVSAWCSKKDVAGDERKYRAYEVVLECLREMAEAKEIDDEDLSKYEPN